MVVRGGSPLMVLFLSPLIVYGWFLTLPWWYGNNLLEVAQREAAPLYAFCFDALKYPLRLPWLTDVDILRFADIDQAFHRVVGHIAGQLNHLNDPTKYMKTADAWMFLAVFMSWLKFLVNALYFLFGVLNMNGEWTNAAVYKDVASQIDHDAVKEGSLKQTEETKKGDASHNQKGMETAFFSPAELREIRILLKERETTSRHRHRGADAQTTRTRPRPWVQSPARWPSGKCETRHAPRFGSFRKCVPLETVSLRT